MLEKSNILNFSREELEVELVNQLGCKPFRARQVFKWVHQKRVADFSLMTDLAANFREQIATQFEIKHLELEKVQLSADGTRKFLLRLHDGSLIESVLIKQPTRYTLCVSSQVGCAIGCKFCRTALMGLKRNLSTAEIIGQVIFVKGEASRIKEQTGESVDFSNIVFMGMGEPLHNYENVIRAIKILNDDHGLSFSSRKITLSTSGLVPAIEKFGLSGAGANLAVSLNATTDEVRSELIPINKRWSLQLLLESLRQFPLKRGKRITIEYVLLRDVNDTSADLARLPKILRDIPVKVNLIPYNENAGLGYKAPKPETVENWQETLLNKRINATIRWSKGLDIDAACGQLATAAKNSSFPNLQ